MLMAGVIFLTGCGPSYRFNKAEKLQEAGRYDEAINRYQTIITKYPDTEWVSKAKESIAESLFEKATELQKTGKCPEAIETYKDIVEKYSSSEWASKARENTATYFFERGSKLQNEGKYQEAISIYQEIAKQYPATEGNIKAEKEIIQCNKAILLKSRAQEYYSLAQSLPSYVFGRDYESKTINIESKLKKYEARNSTMKRLNKPHGGYQITDFRIEKIIFLNSNKAEVTVLAKLYNPVAPIRKEDAVATWVFEKNNWYHQDSRPGPYMEAQRRAYERRVKEYAREIEKQFKLE